MQAPVILVAPEVAKKMILIIKLSGKVELIFLISVSIIILQFFVFKWEKKAEFTV